MISNCNACKKCRNVDLCEPLLLHEIPMDVWNKVATDLFACPDKLYLIVIDYTSKYFELAQLPNASPDIVFTHMKSIFTRHSISVNSDSKRQMLYVAMLFHHLACVCVLHLSCTYVVTLSYHHSIFVLFRNQSPSHLIIYHSSSHSFHLPWSISFILWIIVHHIHIYHIWSYSRYIVIQPFFHDMLINTILLKYEYIHKLASKLMHQSLILRT